MKKSQSYTIQGECPLILHNGQTADPTNHYARLMKAVSGKRSKTDADHEEMARIEWYAGLYIDAQHRICLPGICLEAMIVEAAKKQRKGQQAKAGLYVEGTFPLQYEGPHDIDTLWEDPRFRLTAKARVQRVSIMRTRPVFPEWGCTFTVHFDDALLNLKEITDFVRYAGSSIGLCDWRPRFGRFLLIE